MKFLSFVQRGKRKSTRGMCQEREKSFLDGICRTRRGGGGNKKDGGKEGQIDGGGSGDFASSENKNRPPFRQKE